jgi:hypothetical protein
VLIRVNGAGATDELLDWIVGQRMSYSVGFTLAEPSWRRTRDPGEGAQFRGDWVPGDPRLTFGLRTPGDSAGVRLS